MLFFLICVSSAFAFSFVPLDSNANCKKQGGKKGDYDFNLAVTFWVGTACLKDKPGKGIGPVRGTNLFTLHGIWPTNHTSGYPSCCNLSYPFSSSEIKNVADLQKNWISTQGSDDTFYAHEWEKHGTCMMDLVSSEKDFFTKAVNTNKRLNLASHLANAGIHPGDTLYKKSNVLNALTNGLGHKPLLECTTVNGQQMLSGVSVCLSHSSSLNVQDCSSSYYSKYESKCPSSFYLPAIPDSCYR